MILRYSNLADEDYGHIESYFELYDEVLEKTVSQALSWTPGKKQQWEKIPAPLLLKTWNDFVLYGIVRNEKAISVFENILKRNIVQLDLNTQLMGHSSIDLYLEFEDERFGLTPEEITKVKDVFENQDFAEDENGQPILSDYGLKPLQDLLLKLVMAKSAEDKLVLIDQMLNVCHQRSDLSSLFVEGGTQTLNKLAGK